MSPLGKPQVPPPKKEPKVHLPTEPSEIKIGAQSSASERLGTDKSILSGKYGNVKVPVSSEIHKSDVLPKSGVSGKDGSIFGGKEEISRIEMRQKLKKDISVYKAGMQSGLALSSAEREKLEKELFPEIYGRDISKADLNRRIETMSKERGGTTDIKRKEMLRKEINFLKRIGGIK